MTKNELGYTLNDGGDPVVTPAEGTPVAPPVATPAVPAQSPELTKAVEELKIAKESAETEARLTRDANEKLLHELSSLSAKMLEGTKPTEKTLEERLQIEPGKAIQEEIEKAVRKTREEVAAENAALKTQVSQLRRDQLLAKLPFSDQTAEEVNSILDTIPPGDIKPENFEKTVRAIHASVVGRLVMEGKVKPTNQTSQQVLPGGLPPTPTERGAGSGVPKHKKLTPLQETVCTKFGVTPERFAELSEAMETGTYEPPQHIKENTSRRRRYKKIAK